MSYHYEVVEGPLDGSVIHLPSPANTEPIYVGVKALVDGVGGYSMDASKKTPYCYIWDEEDNKFFYWPELSGDGS